MTKRLVFVCHSFGCYVFAVYCQMFRTDRIIGIIDVGGVPIRFYPLIKEQINLIKNIGKIEKNVDKIYDEVTEENKKKGITAF